MKQEEKKTYSFVFETFDENNLRGHGFMVAAMVENGGIKETDQGTWVDQEDRRLFKANFIEKCMKKEVESMR